MKGTNLLYLALNSCSSIPALLQLAARWRGRPGRAGLSGAGVTRCGAPGPMTARRRDHRPRSSTGLIGHLTVAEKRGRIQGRPPHSPRPCREKFVCCAQKQAFPWSKCPSSKALPPHGQILDPPLRSHCRLPSACIIRNRNRVIQSQNDSSKKMLSKNSTKGVNIFRFIEP